MNRYQAAWIRKYLKPRAYRSMVLCKGTCDFCGKVKDVHHVYAGKGRIREFLICPDCYREATEINKEHEVIRSVMRKKR
jgi:hypothetical protein